MLRLYETVYLQVELGLLEPAALSSLGWDDFAASAFVVRLWPQVRSRVLPEFDIYLEGRGALGPG